MITIHFPKYIQKLTEGVSQHNFDTDSFQTLIDGLRVLFPKLSMHMTNIDSMQVGNLLYFIDKETKEILHINGLSKVKTTELVLIITLYGQGDDFTSFLIGAALIAGGFALGPTVSLVGVTGILTGASLISTGISFLLSGVLSLFNNKTQAATAPNDAAIRAQNDSFGALQNTVTTDTAIPLVYGYHRVPGQFIDGKIKTINHDRDTVVSVANYV